MLPCVQARHYCVINATVPVLQRYYGGEDTRPDFRLGREALQQLMVALKTDRQHGWGRPWRHSRSCSGWQPAYRVVSRVFSMPLPTVFRVVHRIVDEVVAVLPNFVHLPRTQDEFQVVGVVLQAVCDHQGRSIDIFVGYPGSVHDARILKNSPIYTRGNYPPPGYFLLADGGYPCLQEPLALITPYKRPVRGMEEQRFNYHHSRGRTIIKRAFGMMKNRFKCIFLKALEVQTLFVPKVVTACVILHNICVGVGDVLKEVVEEDNNQPPVDLDGGESRSGAAWRATLTNEVSALHEAPLDHDYFCQPCSNNSAVGRVADDHLLCIVVNSSISCAVLGPGFSSWIEAIRQGGETAADCPNASSMRANQGQLAAVALPSSVP
ncbi:hypothetical protein DPEC_G00017550 [Dallia pectoralis]|uniref:Uncharacterized protein n=1 Tax=Dallia pectoralis TaxID=75939 RepID=A0ACC2HFU6_DALPE|nr:hypothetical protein DPEC_G00017550 [Dallia pectoralis]